MVKSSIQKNCVSYLMRKIMRFHYAVQGWTYCMINIKSSKIIFTKTLKLNVDVSSFFLSLVFEDEDSHGAIFN